MSDDTYDLRKERNTRSGQQALRVLLNTDGPKGVNRKYSRGYTFNFEFDDAKRKIILDDMEKNGKTFDEAFDAFMENNK
jgi:hypothetical protein